MLRRGQQQAALGIEVSSQFAAVVVLHEPLLAHVARVALLHDQLVLGLVDGQALARGAVAQLLCVLAICPELQKKREGDTVKEGSKGERGVAHLVALGAVAAEEYHILAGIVQARAIATYFASLAQHPVLLEYSGREGRGKRKAHINTNCWLRNICCTRKISSRVAALLIVHVAISNIKLNAKAATSTSRVCVCVSQGSPVGCVSRVCVCVSGLCLRPGRDYL